MNNGCETPFDSVENAQKYVKLLSEAVVEAIREINNDILVATESGTGRRLQALQVVRYKLEKLELHLKACGRMLNDLLMLRGLLLDGRTTDQKKDRLNAKVAKDDNKDCVLH